MYTNTPYTHPSPRHVYRHLILGVCLAALILPLAGCSHDDESLACALQPICFEAALVPDHALRATVDGTWDGTEEVAVCIGGVVKKFKANTSGQLSLAEGQEPFYWQGSADVSVQAWMPYSDTRPTDVGVSTDQHTPESLAANDFLEASATLKYPATVCRLQFSHSTAQVRVVLLPDDVFATVGLRVTSLTIGGVQATTTLTYDATLPAYNRVLLAPQELPLDHPLVQMELSSGEQLSYRLPAALTLEAGQCLTYQFTVSAGTRILLSSVTGNVDLPLSSYMTGASASQTVFTVPDGGTVIMDGVTLMGNIKCEGDATIYLIGDNVIQQTMAKDVPGIRIGAANTTTTIVGCNASALTIESNDNVPAIGAEVNGTRGSLVMRGGTYTLTGGSWSPAIGCSLWGSVQSITLESGTYNLKRGHGDAAYVGKSTTRSPESVTIEAAAVINEINN